MTPRLAILSMHTSPLAQPGSGDGGGMNVYVRELASALARSGVSCDVFTRADSAERAAIVAVEPGFRVHHIPAGPVGPVPKEMLPALVDDWTEAVACRIERLSEDEGPVAAIHANYWLSGLAGHALKHRFDVPLLVTFHTLDRVKADASPEELSASEPARRAEAESAIAGCADLILAACSVEAEQLADLYGAPRERIAIVAPGVEHAFFAPGDQRQARRAVGLPPGVPVVMFAGRIQPLKGVTVAVEALAHIRGLAGDRLSGTTLVVIGGPSGPHGKAEMQRVAALVRDLRLEGGVRFLPPQRHEALSTFYRAADACVVPSHSESFGLVALEAAACGTPVVASAVGGLTTLVQDGYTGFLVEGRDPSDYAKPLAAILEDPELARRLGAAAASAARGYTWRSAALELWAHCETLWSSALVACT